MPYDRLEGLGVRRHALRVDGGDDHRGIGDPRRVAAVPADDAENLCTDGLGVADRGDQIRADIALDVAAAHRQHEDRILGGQPAHLAAIRRKVLSQPSSLIRAVSSDTLSVGA